MHGAAIAVEKKARQRRRQHHRVPYGDVTGGAADLVLRPRDRHHPRRAGKIRDVEHDLGGAIGLDGDDTGIERQGLLRGRRALQLDRGIAAGLDLSACTLHAVDELTVEVADVGGGPALAEVIVVRRRRLVAGQIEDADNSVGKLMSSASVRALRLIENHCTPMARPGMRSARLSSGRRSVATT